MGCGDFFNCFKPAPHKLKDAKPAPIHPREPPTAPVSSGGGPSNEAPPYGFPFRQPAGSPYGMSKAPSASKSPRNRNAIEEVLNHTSDSEKVKLRNHRNYNAIEEIFQDSVGDYGKEKPRPRIDWVIGLDFGTTYSGFAYARMQDDPAITVYYDWPSKGVETPYCKTLTGLYYRRAGYGKLECASWGYNARAECMDHRNNRHGGGSGHYLTKFKLLLKPASKKGVTDPLEAACIAPPPALTRDTVITDYLRCVGGLALSVLQNHEGDAMSRDSVQWCVTVPSIWDDNAKQKMREYMVNAGLVSAEAGGVDAVKIVLEPEAASFHCHKILREHHRDVSLRARDKILVADVGGGTVDIVVQELIASGHSFQVKELTESSGGLCGGTFVDEHFMRFLSRKIGCLDEFLNKDYPSYRTQLLREWEKIKCSFGHEMISGTVTTDINLHNKLAQKWEDYERERGNQLEDSSTFHLTDHDLTSIFDKVVDEILELIAAQLRKVRDIKVMFVVGGFAGSPYLMRRIRAHFSSKVTHIVSPPNPGSAIVQGAVSLALHPDAIVSRIAKKTYGTSVTLPFNRTLDPPKFLKVTDGVDYCMNRFDVFVKKGSPVEVNKSVVKNYVPHSHGQRKIVFDLYSSDEQDPRHAAEGDTVTKEGGFLVDLPAYPSRDEAPMFDFSMYFGRELIELKAERKLSERVGQEAHTRSIPVKYYS